MFATRVLDGRGATLRNGLGSPWMRRSPVRHRDRQQRRRDREQRGRHARARHFGDLGDPEHREPHALPQHAPNDIAPLRERIPEADIWGEMRNSRTARPLCRATWSVLSLLISYCGSSAVAWCVYPL